jgi:hypothetical protein
MNMPSTVTPPPAYRINYGSVDDCGHETDALHIPGGDHNMFDCSVTYKVDDSHAPNHFLVTVTYGLYYKGEGWAYKTYLLKLQPDEESGDLTVERINGRDQDHKIVSSDSRAYAGAGVSYLHSYRLYFDCTAQYANDEGKTFRQHTRASLCLKTA